MAFFRYIFTNKVTLWSASYSACVVYTKTIIDLSAGESGGYLPSREPLFTPTSVNNCQVMTCPKENIEVEGNKIHSHQVFVIPPNTKLERNCEDIVCFTPAGSQICHGFKEHELIIIDPIYTRDGSFV